MRSWVTVILSQIFWVVYKKILYLLQSGYTPRWQFTCFCVWFRAHNREKMFDPTLFWCFVPSVFSIKSKLVAIGRLICLSILCSYPMVIYLAEHFVYSDLLLLLLVIKLSVYLLCSTVVFQDGKKERWRIERSNVYDVIWLFKCSDYFWPQVCVELDLDFRMVLHIYIYIFQTI